MAPGSLVSPTNPTRLSRTILSTYFFSGNQEGIGRRAWQREFCQVIPVDIHHQCFQQIWTLSGASTRTHPAPFPSGLAERLIRMFSFVGDTVVDPFMGIGTSNAAAAKLGRNSVGIEVVPSYFDAAVSSMEVVGD